jgi:hypothetical protein
VHSLIGSILLQEGEANLAKPPPSKPRECRERAGHQRRRQDYTAKVRLARRPCADQDRRQGLPLREAHRHHAANWRLGAPAIYTLIATAKLNDVDPQTWLADVLAGLPDHPARRLHELLPWNWRPQNTTVKAA